MGKIGWGTNLHAHGDGGDGVHLAFDPGSDRVGLFGELAAQHLVVLLLAQLGLQRAVALRHQLAHLGPLGRDVLRWPPPNHDTPTEKSHKKKEEEEKNDVSGGAQRSAGGAGGGGPENGRCTLGDVKSFGRLGLLVCVWFGWLVLVGFWYWLVQASGKRVSDIGAEQINRRSVGSSKSIASD